MTKKKRAGVPEPRWITTARGQRTVLASTTPLPAGTYTLTADRYTDADEAEYVRGDDVALSADQATRMGLEAHIAPPDSAEAEEARRTPGTRSAEVRP